MFRYNANLAKCSLDALSSLAKYLHNECDRSDPVNMPLHNALLHFLNVRFVNIFIIINIIIDLLFM